MKPIRVFEHERLTIHEDGLGRALTERQFEKLCQFNDKHDNKYFTVIRNGIKFNQYVGVICIGNQTIEILPKADRVEYSKEGFDQTTSKWREVLLRMLAISGEIDLETVSEASLRKRFTLLDLYFEIYLKEVEELLRKGLVKKYRSKAGNVNELKGRIDFSKNIQQNLIHQERFYTTHQTYDQGHLINQILMKGLRILSRISNNQLLSDKIKRALFTFPEIQEIPITKESFERARLTRKTKDYRRAIGIAQMLILNYSPDIANGEENMLALLFDMNKLWEKYIYKKLKEKENENLTVSYHDNDRFWEEKRVYPDIVIRRKIIRICENGIEDEIIEPYIIDTKWKLVDINKPSDDDLKQMYVYNIYWNSPRSILLYPKVNGNKDSVFGKFHKGRAAESHNHCKLGFVSVLGEDGELNQNVGVEVLKKMGLEGCVTLMD